VCAALLLACTKLNPAFDLDTSDGGLPGDSSIGPNTTPTTDGSISTTGVGSHTGGTSTGTATATTLEVTTEPGCGQVGEPCGGSNCCEGCGVCIEGTCMPGGDTCGPCGMCNADSQCTPQQPRTPCKLADDPCSGTLWGLDNGTCFANAPGEGLCDLGGACLPQNCVQGDALAVCDVACVIDPGNCEAGMPVAQVDAALLCAQDGPTPACKSGCVVGGEDSVIQNSCKAGICTQIAVNKCGKYKCKDEQTCGTTCDNNGDCKVGFCTELQTCQ
jgi:hypothetical protein